jgi:DNA-binding transcriptional regulator YiaG
MKSVLIEQSSSLSVSQIPLSEFDKSVTPTISNIMEQTIQDLRRHIVMKSVLIEQSSSLSVSQIPLSDFDKSVTQTISNIMEQTIPIARTHIVMKSLLIDQSSFLSISQIPLSDFDKSVTPTITNVWQQTIHDVRSDVTVKSAMLDPAAKSILFGRSSLVSHSEALNPSTALNGFAEPGHMDFKHKRRVELCRKDDDSRNTEDHSE